MVKISGVVIKGKEKGRKLGFPTANVEILEKIERGVYAGKAVISGKSFHSAIFIPEAGHIVESHILDFTGDIYGQTIEIEIGKKIRDIVRFESEEELIGQIKKDIEIIRKI